MSDINQHSSPESAVEIRVADINTDKTRKADDSDTLYRVCFTLSQNPTQAWRGIFASQWGALRGTQTQPWPEAVIDGRFLFVDCSLRDVQGMYLPVLKKAVAATNEGYKGYAQEQATEQGRREDVWKIERKAVDDMVKSLDFE